MTGGGLAPDGTRWVRSRPRHLLPVRVLGRLFRGKFLAGLAREYTAGHLQLGGACAGLTNPRAFAQLRRTLTRQDWVVYAKRPFAGPRQVFRYLGRYTHRVGVANHRLLAVDDTAVRFATKHGRSVRLAPDEFIRRFLLHVLPPGFVKIRHVGLFAPGRAGAAYRARARQLLRVAAPPPASTVHEDWATLLTRLTGRDPRRCRHCLQGTLVRHPLPLAVPARSPPLP